MSIEQLKVSEENNDVIVEGIKDFNVDHIFDCGQCFRWEKTATGSYKGIAFGRIVEMEMDEKMGTLTIHNSNEEDFYNIWSNYLDLNRDYSKIKSYLKEHDQVILDAVEYGYGIRILNQEKWETLLSFIISQNNNIPRIKKCIEALAQTLGDKAGEYKGKTYYNLPSPKALAQASIEDLAPCKLGYRAKYLIETARKVCEEGKDGLEKLSAEDISSAEAIEALREYSGVGPKVANCISLFSLGRIDSFPIDVWVKKVMNKLYGFAENDMKGMANFAAERFGEYGGIAQQYLFYYITHNKNGL